MLLEKWEFNVAIKKWKNCLHEDDIGKKCLRRRICLINVCKIKFLIPRKIMVRP